MTALRSCGLIAPRRRSSRSCEIVNGRDGRITQSAGRPADDMRASSLIEVLQGLGCTVSLARDGASLAIEATEPPPAPLLALVQAHKPALLHELQTPATWTPADWRAHFHERAAVLEYDAGLSRAIAEEEALQACFQLWSGRRCG